MPEVEFRSLLLCVEIAAVVLTTLILKKWMVPPPGFGGRYWRSLLACVASIPVSIAAVLVSALVVGYPADESYSPGIVAGGFLVASAVRALVIWPFVVAWLLMKPRDDVRAGA